MIEKKIKNSLTKVAVVYLGSEKDPILLKEVPEEHLKIEHPHKENVMKLMKSRMNSLQEENRRLLENQHKSLYQRIQGHLNDKSYYQLTTWITAYTLVWCYR